MTADIDPKSSGRDGVNYFMSFLATGVLMISCGNVLSWPSPTIPHLQSHKSPLPIKNDEAAAIGNIFYLGTICGVTIVVPILKCLGRKPSLILTGFMYSASWVVLFFTHYSIWVIYAARFMAGMAQPWSLALAPLYMVEISRVKWRQAVGNGLNFFINVGLVIQYSFGPALSYFTLLYINLGISLSFILIFSFYGTESPTFLVLKGRNDEAREVLRYYRKHASEDGISHEISIIQATVQDSTSLTLWQQVKALLFEEGNRNTLLLILGLTYFYVFSGVSQLIAFSETLFRLSEVKISPAFSTLMVGGMKLIGGIFLPFLVRWAGMKKMIMVSSFSSGIAMFFLGLHFFLRMQGYHLSQIYWIPLSSAMAYFFFVTVGVSFMTQYLRAEMFAIQVKALGIAVQEFVNCVMLELCSLFFTGFIMGGKGSALPYAPFIPLWVFSASLLAAGPFVLYLLPDTKTMNLHQIQEMLSPQNTKAKSKKGYSKKNCISQEQS